MGCKPVVINFLSFICLQVLLHSLLIGCNRRCPVRKWVGTSVKGQLHVVPLVVLIILLMYCKCGVTVEIIAEPINYHSAILITISMHQGGFVVFDVNKIVTRQARTAF